jgi:hypothetical protein
MFEPWLLCCLRWWLLYLERGDKYLRCRLGKYPGFSPISGWERRKNPRASFDSDQPIILRPCHFCCLSQTPTPKLHNKLQLAPATGQTRPLALRNLAPEGPSSTPLSLLAGASFFFPPLSWRPASGQASATAAASGPRPRPSTAYSPTTRRCWASSGAAPPRSSLPLRRSAPPRSSATPRCYFDWSISRPCSSA